MQIIAEEIKRRGPLTVQAMRLFHGRGHRFPGYEDLTIDWFKPVALIQLYQPRQEQWLRNLVGLLLNNLPGIKCILLQERYLTTVPSRLLWGNLPEAVDAVEDGLRFRLRLNASQNIGFFPDMAVGRRLVRRRSAGKKVLNLFAYSCSFSVAALAGGAAQVINLDMNRGALALGKLNHQLNDIDPRRCSFLALELFRSFSKLKKIGPFDLIICDPPAAQGRSFSADRHWPKLVRRLPDLLSGEGEVLACFNDPGKSLEGIQLMFAEQAPKLKLLRKLQPGEDFPEADPAKGVWLIHCRKS